MTLSVNGLDKAKNLERAVEDDAELAAYPENMSTLNINRNSPQPIRDTNNSMLLINERSANKPKLVDPKFTQFVFTSSVDQTLSPTRGNTLLGTAGSLESLSQEFKVPTSISAIKKRSPPKKSESSTASIKMPYLAEKKKITKKELEKSKFGAASP